MIIVFLKSILRPKLSVKCPSSSTWSIILKTSGCAFSISSKRTTQYGFLLTFSVNCPPSSYPTYPGGAPTNLDIANFSMYSLMSIRTKASSESNNSFARTLANWVLPTPVWPKKINEPIGLFGSFNPARFLWMDFAIFITASSCPITLPLISSGSLANLLLSVCAIRFTGIPVIIETTSATLSSVTVTLLSFASFSHCSCAIAKSFSICFSSSRSLAASSYFCFLTTVFFSSRTSSNFFSNSKICLGTSILIIWTREPDSSKASIALSGRNRSVMYLLVSFTQASIASGV